jgi:tRNA threonylcarbamoyladenosine biosynthesis protein TsaE
MQYTVEHIPGIAQSVLTDLVARSANTLALHGDLGAGKTTLVSAIAKELGVVESIISPTFIVYRVYEVPDGRPLRSQKIEGRQDPVTNEQQSKELNFSWKKLVHIDAYRLEGEVDAKKIRLDELFADPANLVCIEWPENVGEVLSKNALHATIAYTGEHERSITIA